VISDAAERLKLAANWSKAGGMCLAYGQLMRFLLALFAAFTFAGCTTITTASPTGQPVDLTGKWVGNITVLGQTGTATLDLKQSGANVSGPVTISLPNGVVVGNGMLTGTLDGTTLKYTIDVPAGGIPSEPNCSGQITGTAMVTVGSPSTLTGNFQLTSNTCNQVISGGNFTVNLK